MFPLTSYSLLIIPVFHCYHLSLFRKCSEALLFWPKDIYGRWNACCWAKSHLGLGISSPWQIYYWLLMDIYSEVSSEGSVKRWEALLYQGLYHIRCCLLLAFTHIAKISTIRLFMSPCSLCWLLHQLFPWRLT